MRRQFLAAGSAGYVGAGLIALAALVLLGPSVIGGDDASLQPGAAEAAAPVDIPPAEVMHFWVSGSERAAIDIIRDDYVARNHQWIDSPQPSQTDLRRTLMDRFATGTPPAAVLWQSNVELRDLAELGLFSRLDVVAERQNWDENLAPAVRAQVQVDGHYYMAPTNIHGLNWIFYSTPMLERHGLTEPRNWDEVLSAMRRIEAAGERPVAIGPGDWEGMIAFNSILAGSIGRDDYNALIHRQDASILQKPSALQAFRTFAAFRDIVRRNPRYDNWAQAAQGLARGEAGFDFMGDWAKGEMARVGARFGPDVGCMLAPGAQDTLIVTIDGFAFPADQSPERIAARDALAATMAAPEVQRRFAATKGTVAARMDGWPREPDICEAIMIDRLSDANAIASPPNAALPSALAGDYQIVMANFFNDASMTPEQGLAHLRLAFDR